MKTLSITEVSKMIGLSHATILKKMRKGEFPQRMQISKRRFGWDEKDITEWMEHRPRVDGASESTDDLIDFFRGIDPNWRVVRFRDLLKALKG